MNIPSLFKLSFVLFSLLNMASCSYSESEKQLQTEVLVIGGTTGGTSAGIQSARLKARTLIVEETTWLGGMITAAGVSATDGNHELSSGIWNEFREKLRKHYGGAAALSTGWVSETQFEPHVGDSIFKAMTAAEKIFRCYMGIMWFPSKKKAIKFVGHNSGMGKTIY
jgi:thioredoxin reductase